MKTDLNWCERLLLAKREDESVAAFLKRTRLSSSTFYRSKKNGRTPRMRLDYLRRLQKNLAVENKFFHLWLWGFMTTVQLPSHG